MSLAFFEPTLGDLVDALPSSWRAKDDPQSELGRLLGAVAEIADELAAAAESIYADQALETAGDEALRREWALLYGAANEQLPFDTETLRGYLIARAQEDGTKRSLITTLLSLLQDPANAGIPDEGGVLHWAADGSGMHWAADGSGVAFGPAGKVEVIEDAADHTFTVNVQSVLVFDRPAFARAVARFRPADCTTPTITEV